MKQDGETTALFLDIGGVLLSNGWDRRMRKAAAEKFGLDSEEMDERHHLTFDTYEEGKLELAEYLRRVVFYTDRRFSPEEFKAFMFAQSQPKPEMIDLVRGLKRRYGLKVAAVSNEGRELTVHRVKKFSLGSFIDFFVSSCFVHVRKPDPDIYHIALDIAQVMPEKVIYIDDRAMFVDIAADLGIRGIHHRGYDATRAALGELGLSLA
jgi:putative hydrolase of the HAD superfamily